MLLGCGEEARESPDASSQGGNAAPQYVGGDACGECHAEERERWRGSHHDLAMQVASEGSVLGDFAGATFRYAGTTTTFFRRDGEFFVRTDGPDGELRDFRISHTFGAAPLQQYLVAFPGGRYQALGIAWDSRRREEGGQRWFHLYPEESITHTDVLHWTRPSQSWNAQCAECHSTSLRKGYRADEDRYETTFAEIDVACEACHGPGSRHVEWARSEGGRTRSGEASRSASAAGLVVELGERERVAWRMDAAAGIARRDPPGSSRLEVEVCARCHARRASLFEDYLPGRPLLDTHRPALLEEGLYYADGQMEGEVYSYGSFLQSRMFAGGVTCSDCHDPHTGRLRAQGNALCSTCHLPERFDASSHHFHRPASPGAACVSCHMPARTYMVVDRRHDHGFRIPRPDLTLRFDVPNACNDCHVERSARWAAEALDRWLGPRWRERAQFAEALHSGRTGRADAEKALARLAEDVERPPLVRATALSLLTAYLSPFSLPVVERGLRNAEPLVRLASLDAAEALPPELRAELLAPLLVDPMRVVRAEAAAALAGPPERLLGGRARTELARALEEYRAAQEANLDRPESHLNLSLLHLRREELPEAERACAEALRVAPWFIPARVNLAEIQRLQGRETEAEASLRKALEIDSENAEVRYAFGLSLVRQRRPSDALGEFERATRSRPGNARFGHAYALALQSLGRDDEALEVLKRTHERVPASREVLLALIESHHRRGELETARGYAEKLSEISPERPGAMDPLEAAPR